MAQIVDLQEGACRKTAGFTCLVDGDDGYPAVCVGDDGNYFTVTEEDIAEISAEEALGIWMDTPDENKRLDDNPAVEKMMYDVKYGVA